MEGVIVNFRGGKHTKHNSQMILEMAGIDDREKAASLVGKTVTWASPAKSVIKGTIASAHGNSGALRVKFEKGMPGQAIGKKVKVE